MRRKDKEITDPAQLEDILRSCEVCYLALQDGDAPYVIPLNFGHTCADSQITLYFHCAREGHKLDLLQRNPNAAFSMSTGVKLHITSPGCGSTSEYQSLCGAGILTILSPEQNQTALAAVTRHYAPADPCQFDPAAVRAVVTLALRVTRLTGKQYTLPSSSKAST